jgi:hypothetical protein
MKYNENNKNRWDKDEVLAVNIMKGEYPYNNVIRDIGNDRFFIHYWAATEVNAFRNYCKRNLTPPPL